MEYVCNSARFKFFNGTNVLTVEYVYILQSWYIFKEDQRTNAIFQKKIEPKKSKSPNRQEAEFILEEFLESQK